MTPIHMVWSGDPRTKKNHSQIRKGKGGRRTLAPSKQFLRYEEEALPQVPDKLTDLRLSGRYNIKALYFMQTRRRVDLVNLLQGTLDICVRAGVLEDDNSNIAAAYDGSRVLYDKENPRVEITISDLESEE